MAPKNRNTATQQSADVSSLNVDPEDMLAQIEALGKQEPTATDDEWKTAAEWAAYWGLTVPTAQKRLKAAVAGGLMEGGKRPRRNAVGHIQRVAAYRWVGDGMVYGS